MRDNFAAFDCAGRFGHHCSSMVSVQSLISSDVLTHAPFTGFFQVFPLIFIKQYNEFSELLMQLVCWRHRSLICFLKFRWDICCVCMTGMIVLEGQPCQDLVAPNPRKTWWVHWPHNLSVGHAGLCFPRWWEIEPSYPVTDPNKV